MRNRKENEGEEKVIDKKRYREKAWKKEKGRYKRE